MARRRRAQKREILPDPRFGDILISKFMNVIMEDGKKSVAEGIVYRALADVQAAMKIGAVEAFHQALNKVRPSVEVRSRRVGGATYQVPVEVRPDRAVALAMRWIANAMRARSELTAPKRLAREIMDALNDTGGAIKKRLDTHRMAEANKAFAHYRW